MTKYKKKPVIIEALQLRWDSWPEMCTHAGVGKLSDNKPERAMGPNNSISLLIPTLEGIITANEFDWVIKGIQGELYPCKPSIFEATYEEVFDIEEWLEDKNKLMSDLDDKPDKKDE